MKSLPQAAKDEREDYRRGQTGDPRAELHSQRIDTLHKSRRITQFECPNLSEPSLSRAVVG
jgi:hypothetical protein